MPKRGGVNVRPHAAFEQALAIVAGGAEVVVEREGAETVGPLTADEALGLVATVANARAKAEAQPETAPVLLTIAEAARLGAMTPRALWHLRQRGLLPSTVFVAMGRSVRVHRERFIAALGKSRAGR